KPFTFEGNKRMRAAEDGIAAAFLAAFQSRGGFDAQRGESSALPWLFGIATNTIRQERRLEQRWLAQRAAGTGDWPTSGDNLDSWADSMSTQAEVAKALRGLSPKLRDPFLLRVIADLEYDVIAVALDIPLGTVRSRINRARAALSRHLKEHDHA
ncbi:MAG: RNA polymerase sigma factor, partial [Thermoleophilia bacterium]|nr:RNA polymerase sigma factor [Thermoleophilia bacterium]